MEVRIGELLVHAGVLTDMQVRELLARQRACGEPFGALSERLFGVHPRAVEDAWAKQYARLTRRVDPIAEDFDPRVRALVQRRQAWQFRVLPIRFDNGELMMATTERSLVRALGFATRVIGAPTFLVLAEPAALGRALCAQYPLPGMTAESIEAEGAAA